MKINITAKTNNHMHCVETGQKYMDVSCLGKNKVYLVTRQNTGEWMLVNIETGHAYRHASDDPQDIFAGDDEDFVLLHDFEIQVTK